MLETNKPYMFGSTTTTTTTTTATTSTSNQTSSSNHLPGIQQSSQQQQQQQPPPPSQQQQQQQQNIQQQQQQQQRPIHHTNFYYGRQEEDVEEAYSSYHGQPARLNSAFGRHLDNYTYKPTNDTSFPTRPIVYSPATTTAAVIKREEPNLILPTSSSSTPAATATATAVVVEDSESSWFDNSTVVHSDGLYADSSDNKRIKRQKEMSSKMEKLNLDFLEKKEGLYSEKLVLINTELKEANLDAHYHYIEGLRNLEEMRKKMISDGVLFREYQNQVTDKQFQLEIYQAEEEYTAETQEIREKLFTILEEKRRKLKEDKDNCDLAYGTYPLFYLVYVT
ncbi:hypothetical protein HPULCUR_001963 [Helicostylum pulchrum]|uniref:Uncharacterized protein n=1 Tax=Helicostylum pulchrum TaxID=562976 RepID=A0ABP9XP79_9FUNG